MRWKLNRSDTDRRSGAAAQRLSTATIDINNKLLRLNYEQIIILTTKKLNKRRQVFAQGGGRQRGGSDAPRRLGRQAAGFSGLEPRSGCDDDKCRRRMLQDVDEYRHYKKEFVGLLYHLLAPEPPVFIEN